MTFWEFLGYVLSLFKELLNSPLCYIDLPTGDGFTLTFGAISVFCILLGIIIHLLVPSAKGV